MRTVTASILLLLLPKAEATVGLDTSHIQELDVVGLTPEFFSVFVCS